MRQLCCAGNIAQVLVVARAANWTLPRWRGLAGKTPMEEAQVDSIYDDYKDFVTELRPYFLVAAGMEKGDKAKLEKEVVIPARDKHVPAIEKFLAKSGSGYLVGKSVTWADLVISDSLATWETFVPSFLDGHSEVKKFVERIRELPNIKKWISERPKTPF
ncbi:Glutathione S-transferase 1 [Toxocara canis]|uniref:glutathione transferase n=2 Tax=Toxocara canis TaxID=6265 RepID=A0A0B2UYV4_TOXCA|nr:Glutathione S-transferase 1 [Toxocara canis]